MKHARLIPAGGALLALATAGCGNQMYRQPSYTPLDTPRAAPPADAVPVSAARTPADGRPVVSTAFGDRVALPGEPAPQPAIADLSRFPAREPDLPPPNLSDQARYQRAPQDVDALHPPVPLADPRIVASGHILFLNRCVQCHNAGGYGYGTVAQYLVPHPPDLAAPLVQRISNGALFWHITMGQGKMPGFRHWTTPAQRWCLAAYVRSLGGKPPDPAAEQTSTALQETPRAPYPVYGLQGYERGDSAYPFKTLRPPTSDPASRRSVINQGFGQPPPASR